MKTGFFLTLAFLATLFTQVAFGQVQEANSPFFFNDPSKAVHLYPNPATDFITIKLELPIAKRTKVSMHNIIGNLLEVEAEILDDFEIRVRTKDLPVGYYMIALRDGDSAIKGSFKFLKR